MSARTQDMPQRLPLASNLATRDGDLSTVTGARLINGYAEYDGELQSYTVYKRPGFNATATYAVGGAGGAQGMAVFSAALSPSFALGYYILSVNTDHLYNASSSVSALVTAGMPVSFEYVPIANPTAFINTLSDGYVVTLASMSIAHLTSADWLAMGPRVPGAVYLDGTTYVMDLLGNVRGSAIDDPTTWDPLNSIQVNSSSDLPVALAKQLTYVIAFKQTTAEVFYDAGNQPPGSPLSPVPNAFIPYGCAAAFTVATIDMSMLWVSRTRTGGPQVVQMDNLSPFVVSTPDVDRILNKMQFASTGLGAVQDGVYATAFKIGGHRFYVVQIQNLKVSLVYDLDQKVWEVWTDSAGTASWPVFGVQALPASVGGPPVYLAQMDGAGVIGSIYNMNEASIYPMDINKPCPVDIYTPLYDGSINRVKQLNMLYVNADQVTGSLLQARYTDDDYRHWSNFRVIDLSRKRPSLPNNGTFKRRAYHFRHQKATPLRIASIDLQMDVGVL